MEVCFVFLKLSHLTSTLLSHFLLIKDKPETKKTHNQEAMEGGCSKDLARHLKKWKLQVFSSNY